VESAHFCWRIHGYSTKHMRKIMYRANKKSRRRPVDLLEGQAARTQERNAGLPAAVGISKERNGKPMSETFEYDVFLSHSSKDAALVRRLANRLRDAGLRVWFDKWAIAAGDDIFLKIERGLQGSRTLVLVISFDALSSDWVTLERNTALFRDPINKNRRFIPVLIDDCENMPDTLRRYRYVDMRRATKKAFHELIEACRGGT
jgi:hypothetical protein